MSNEPDWLEDLYAEGGDEQPPAELDDRIRAAARQPVRLRWYRSPARLATLATAASLVIAASIIYFEPTGEMLLEAPVESVVDEVRADQETVPAPARKTSARELAEPKRQQAERVERDAARSADADQFSTIEESAITGALPEAPAGRAEQAAVDAPLPAAAAAPLLDQEAVSRDLEQQCGPLPGTEEDRALHYDGADWLVIVRIGEDVRIWRCRDGAWIEVESEQQ